MSDAGSSVVAASEPIYSLPHQHLHPMGGGGHRGGGGERQRKNSHGSCGGRSDRAGSVVSSTKSSASHHLHQKQLQVTYKTKKTTTGLFKKKNTVVDSGSFRKNSAG